jgi:hypothetical protein
MAAGARSTQNRSRQKRIGGASPHADLKVAWHMPIEVQSIDPGTPEVNREAEFQIVVSPNRLEIGYMRRVLEKSESQPLTLPVTFSDLHGTVFNRIFILRRGEGRGQPIIVRLGSLQST